MAVIEVNDSQSSSTSSSEPSCNDRRTAWKKMLLSGLSKEVSREEYDCLCQRQCEYDDLIERDVHRTLPREPLFREKGGVGQSSLFRVLHALAVQHGDIGYVQGLNFVVATIINTFPDDEVLVFNFASAMLFRHSLADFYRPSFPKLGVATWQFDRLVEGFLPRVHAVLRFHEIGADFYATQWFLTLFVSDLPQKVVVQIWDRFLLVGWQAIAQVALALLAEVQHEICSLSDSCEIMTLLKGITKRCRLDGDSLLLAAARFEVSHRMLSDLEAAYSRGEEPEHTKLAHERDATNGAVRWYVRRISPTKMRSYSDPLPWGSETTSLRPSSPSATTDVTKVTVLPFVVRNLDTGETTLLEEEWAKHMREEQAPGQEPLSPLPTLLNRCVVKSN